MKNSVLKSVIVLILLVLFVFFELYGNKTNSYKILKVIEADKFYLDFNHDSVADVDELVKLSDIIAFSPIKNSFTDELSNSIGLTAFDFMKNGYLAREWAKDNLEGKTVKLTKKYVQYTKYSKYTFIKAELNSKDLGEILLEKGLALPYKNNETYEYFQLQNNKTIVENISKINDLKFLIVNKSNNIVHKLSCEYALKIHSAELILEKNISKYNLQKCKYCFKIVDKFLANLQNIKSKNVYKKSISKKFGEIEIFLINPLEYNKPSPTCRTKICKTIVSEINASKTSIDIALYGFSSQDDILKALINAKNRGVNVRAVMDYSSKTDSIYKDSMNFINTFQAKTDSSETLMHNKFFIFDNKKVLTGSMNISSSGSGGYNANVMVLVDSAELANIYTVEFNQMYSNKFQQSKKKIDTKTIELGKSKVTPYFSPKSDIYKNAILPMVSNAKNDIFVSIFYMTDKRLTDELIKARKRGVNVIVLWDALGAINFKNLFNDLRREKVLIKAENWGGKNHEKTILADNKLLIGSSNFSLSGFNKNDENAIVIESADIAEFYKDYFLYLFSSINDKYSNYIPRAESLESVNSCYDGIDNNFDGFKDGEDEGCKHK